MAERQDETPGETTGKLVRQPHGGALYQGPAPGRRRSGGRTPSALRRMALKKGPKMLQVLESIALDENAKQSDRVAAAKEHMRIALSNTMSRDEVRQKLEATIMAVETMLPEDQAAKVIYELRKIWLG